MNLYSGAPYWLVRNGLPQELLPLSQSTEAGVVVVGGGITGALIADALSTAGEDVLLLDARAPGAGSTAASTALIQYEIDLELQELVKRLGEARAVAAYRCALDGVQRLRELSDAMDGEASASSNGTVTLDAALPSAEFTQRNSLYLASHRRDGRRLAREAALRERHHIPIEYWDATRVEGRYGFASHGALFSDCAATMDPMRFTAGLLARAGRNGARIAGRTRVTGLASFPDHVVVSTDVGAEVRARCVVIATGYESPLEIVQSYVQLRSTYALVTEPLRSFGAWDDGTLVWETRRPYGYMRTSPDGRIIAGGGDVGFKAEGARDVMLHAKAGVIAKRLARTVPDVVIDVAHSWTGTFGETADGLPYIGEHPALPNVLFALGYGGNGITFSAIASDLIVQLVQGECPKEAALFGFGR